MKTSVLNKNLRISILLVGFIINFSILLAQEHNLVALDRMLVSDKRLDNYLSNLRNDSTSLVSISFIKITNQNLIVQKIECYDGYYKYIDTNTGIEKKKKNKKSHFCCLDDFSDFYYFKDEKYCDEIQIIALKDRCRVVIVFSISCNLYEYFYTNKSNPFNINRKIIRDIENVKEIEY